jgi:hypothetical protein
MEGDGSNDDGGGERVRIVYNFCDGRREEVFVDRPRSVPLARTATGVVLASSASYPNMTPQLRRSESVIGALRAPPTLFLAPPQTSGLAQVRQQLAEQMENLPSSYVNVLAASAHTASGSSTTGGRARATKRVRHTCTEMDEDEWRVLRDLVHLVPDEHRGDGGQILWRLMAACLCVGRAPPSEPVLAARIEEWIRSDVSSAAQ